MNKCVLLLVSMFVFVSPAVAQDVATPDFAGVKSCAKCHRKVYKSWKKSKMAMALDILKPGERAEMKKKAGLDPQKDYTKDTTCLPCHTTGYGKTGGFVSMEKTPLMVGISCEACHGPGKVYNKIMKKRGRVYQKEELLQAGFNDDPRKSCEQCHNDKSPTRKFQDPFDANLPKWPAHDPVKLKYHTESYMKSK